MSLWFFIFSAEERVYDSTECKKQSAVPWSPLYTTLSNVPHVFSVETGLDCRPAGLAPVFSYFQYAAWHCLAEGGTSLKKTLSRWQHM